MRGRGLTWVETVRDVPRDDNRERGRGRPGNYILGAPAQNLSVRPAPRTLPYRWQVPARSEQLAPHRVHAARPCRPVDERPPLGEGPAHTPAETARCRLLWISDRDELQILAPERHDHVGRADFGVAPARNRLQAVLLAQLVRAVLEVRHRQQYMVDDGGRVEILRRLREVGHPSLVLTNVWR